jgi:hypothetical protein
MPLTIACPSCGFTGKAPSKLAGKRLTCPRCRKPVPAPRPPSGDAVPVAVGVAPPPAAGIAVVCPVCRETFSVGAELAGTAVPCRRCREPIRVPGEADVVEVPDDASGEERVPFFFRLPRPVLDGVAGGGLAFVLLFVFVLDRLFSSSVPANTLAVNVVSDASSRAAAAKRLRLAVTPTFVERDPFSGAFMPWDDMSKLLGDLGEGYRFDLLPPRDLLNNPRVLDQYDILFLTCAPGGQELKDVLASYVSRGGTLYASDWRFDAVAAAFPEYVDAAALGSGTRENVTADVVDPALRELVGPTLPLHFNLPRWKTAAFRGPRVTTLLQGSYHKQRHPRDPVGDPAFAPLLVKFSFGKGTVIFTSFHNEKQNSDVERKLLEYLVFSLVTADVHADVTASIQGAGFAPQKSNLLSTPRDNPSVSRTYANNKVQPLRFALGFRNEGATFRLMLKSPDGKTYTWEGTSTVILEVPDALPGEWTYTVTAVQLPYENFPFTVTVSEKK